MVVWGVVAADSHHLDVSGVAGLSRSVVERIAVAAQNDFRSDEAFQLLQLCLQPCDVGFHVRDGGFELFLPGAAVRDLPVETDGFHAFLPQLFS